MQQGGLGLILTMMMIISVPPMAAAFFNGVLGQFTGYNTFGGGVPAGARGPGSPPLQRADFYSRTAMGSSTAADEIPLRRVRIFGPMGLAPKPPACRANARWFTVTASVAWPAARAPSPCARRCRHCPLCHSRQYVGDDSIKTLGVPARTSEHRFWRLR